MYYYKLKKKTIICIEGKDAISFLQGIISNNTNKLLNNRAIYSTLLSPQGKLLHDFFLFREKNKIYLDPVDSGVEKLNEKLNLYKLNSEINISKKKIFSYFLFFGKSINKILGLKNKLGEYKKLSYAKVFNDPRNINLGLRIICNSKKEDVEINKIIKSKKLIMNYDEYEKTRIMNCIPDIDKDNLYNNAYLLQYNFENINSICWKKGCFIGQEVTVKMKNRGSLKKKLFTIKSFTKKFKSPEEIKYKNQIIGSTTSHFNNIALALLKINKISNIRKKNKVIII
ncbi:MAG: tRNA-modifying protein YgfZ [Alphaproteobacteria bacterium MarineAlpha6_Bin4]|nr:MAG: tRNA-modifying protein YgfZ [Alphaproteobacteria bacterium MarineAlpha6_Bin3]PPR38502.1 MAG: tRNA-modifying protein YgfZ [Alphaproteobacteria bacterium MarineAlpha6_Bin4]|tara:strand:+ start:2647 stop:3498 length:852 start_codon:yes stop_codon:yes gene_type:complete